jgi:hypothetical protein
VPLWHPPRAPARGDDSGALNPVNSQWESLPGDPARISCAAHGIGPGRPPANCGQLSTFRRLPTFPSFCIKSYIWGSLLQSLQVFFTLESPFRSVPLGCAWCAAVRAIVPEATFLCRAGKIALLRLRGRIINACLLKACLKACTRRGDMGLLKAILTLIFMYPPRHRVLRRGSLGYLPQLKRG